MPEHSRARDDDARLYLLVLRCQTGDETAFGRLMDWFGARTLATIAVFLRLRTSSLAEIQLRLAALEDMLASSADAGRDDGGK